jgi:hypothetical protein
VYAIVEQKIVDSFIAYVLARVSNALFSGMKRFSCRRFSLMRQAPAVIYFTPASSDFNLPAQACLYHANQI